MMVFNKKNVIVSFLLSEFIVCHWKVFADSNNLKVDKELEIPARGMRAGGTVTQNLFSYSATCSSAGYEGVCVSISSGCCTTPSCSTPSGSGVCMATTQCSGTTVAGYCAGPSDLQCCISSSTSCSTLIGSGTCTSESSCASSGGVSVPEDCPGSSDNQCCVHGTYGNGNGKSFDISSTLTASAASCFVSNGYKNIISRGYQSLGYVDTQICKSLRNAFKAGMIVRSAATQMIELVNYLTDKCKKHWTGRVWLDIEGAQYLLGNTTSNQAWYKQLKDSCKISEVSCGIYSSIVEWTSIFGSPSFAYGSECPLWYAHYDNIPSFYDFVPFGGWSKPFAKQYGGGTSCNTSAGYNFAPYRKLTRKAIFTRFKPEDRLPEDEHMFPY